LFLQGVQHLRQMRRTRFHAGLGLPVSYSSSSRLLVVRLAINTNGHYSLFSQF